MDDIFQKLAAEVRAARKRAGLTQEQLASSIDVTPVTISQIERGQRRPSLETIVSLAQAVPVDFVRVFSGDRSRKRTTAVRAQLEADLTQNMQDLNDRDLHTVVGLTKVLLTNRN